MARAIWTGAISFGLVNVPVKLFSATSPKTVRFHQLAGPTGARVKQKRVDSVTGEEVPYEDIVKGFELTPEHYVVITQEELDALDPKATRTVDIEEFVDLVDIDPIYYDHSYYLAPTQGGTKAYRLLLDAMEEAGKVGIGRFVLRSKQQLCALRPTGNVLTLSTMLFGDEVLSPDRIDELDAVADVEAGERELKMAQQLIETLSAKFEPERFKDDHRERVLELIEKKAAGEEIAVAPQAEEPAAAPDLMAALEASLAAMSGAGKPASSKRTASKPPPGKGPAAKPAARKRAPGKAAASTEEDQDKPAAPRKRASAKAKA